MKNLPIGVQTFSKLIEGNYLYIDKTEHIYNLFAKGGQYYFLSRPRRFGKSLLVSTLSEIFAGNMILFKGLWIYDKIDWTSHPVIHLDLSQLSFKTPDMLEEALDNNIKKIAENYEIELDQELFLKEKFGQLIEKLAQNQKVVILIDEYDKPIIEYLEAGQIEIAKQIRTILKHFFAVIKASDRFLRFVFITGVSRFSKISLFSDLNNLTDITLFESYSNLLGYTQEEFDHYFPPYIERMAKKKNIAVGYLKDTIRKWYNGYSWDGKRFVYNPYSILHLFAENSFGNFWFSTGTPTFLIKNIKEQQYDITEFENLPVDAFIFDNYDIGNLDAAALLFQTGYLTVKRITLDNEEKTYELSYPNHEVKNSLLTHLFGEYTQNKPAANTRLLKRMSRAIEAGDMEQFIREIKILFASIPYHIFIGDREAYYHSIIYLALSLSGAAITPEDPTNAGRIDAVVETSDKIINMEFKMGDEKEALKQIKEKKYYEKFLNKGKQIILMGIGFDSKQRNIGDVLQETIPQL